MRHIYGGLRVATVFIAVALLVACGGGDATAPRQAPLPVDTIPASVVGAWAAHRIDDRALPALVKSGAEPAGWTWAIHVRTDSLLITADGRWVQRVRVDETNSLGETYPQIFLDRGAWTRQGDTLQFVSTFIMNVSFSGHRRADGVLVVDHDFLHDDDLPVMRQEMRR